MTAFKIRHAQVIPTIPPELRCSPSCLTWKLINAEVDPEIQVCDACWDAVDPRDAERPSDTEVAQLPEARLVLRIARDQLAAKRERARANRRTARIVGDSVLSACCDANVYVRGVSVVRTAFDIERDTPNGDPIVRQIVISAPTTSGEPDMIEPDTAVCSACGRQHNLPEGLVTP